MTPDDETGLEALLRARYWAMVRKELDLMAAALGWNETQALEHSDALARLFARYNSIPAYSAWRADVLRAEIAETQRAEPTLPRSPPQAEPRLRAVQILGGERATRAEYAKLFAWGDAHHRRALGDDKKWNLTEEEMQEALR